MATRQGRQQILKGSQRVDLAVGGTGMRAMYRHGVSRQVLAHTTFVLPTFLGSQKKVFTCAAVEMGSVAGTPS